MFSLICTWTNVWANTRDASDLRRHCVHYDVTVMEYDAYDKMYMITNCRRSKWCWSKSVKKLSSFSELQNVDYISHLPDFSMMTSSNGNIFRVTGPFSGEFTVTGEFPSQRPVTRSFDVFFDLRFNKRLSKQSLCWWFETLSRPVWRQCNERCFTLLSKR